MLSTVFEWVRRVLLRRKPPAAAPAKVRRKRETKDQRAERLGWESPAEMLDELTDAHQLISWPSRYAGNQGDIDFVRRSGVYIPMHGQRIYMDDIDEEDNAEAMRWLPFRIMFRMGGDNPKTDRLYHFHELLRMEKWQPEVFGMRIGKLPGNPIYYHWIMHYQAFGKSVTDLLDKRDNTHAVLGVYPDGNVRACTYIKPMRCRFRGKRGWVQIERSEWKDVKNFTVDDAKKTWAQSFKLVSMLARQRDMGLLIRAERDGVAAVTSIPMHVAKDLFSERVKVKTSSGRTRPIFHYVKAHTRVTGSNVKMHMRGLRQFRWGDFDVSIALPGKHTRMISTAQFGARIMDKREPIPSGYTTGETRLAEAMAEIA